MQIQGFISYTLEADGYRVLKTESGKEAARLVLTGQADFLLLDMGLPDMDGMDVLRRVREWSEIPVIIVSARDQDIEKVAALDLGADDYLTKPFSARELLARIRVALRHMHRGDSIKDETILHNGELTVEVDRHLVYKNRKEIHLTKLEYDLLALLMRNQGKVLTYGYVLDNLYGKNYGTDTQALRALMAGLRRKIEEKSVKPKYIVTEIGIGYRMPELGEN